MLKDKITNALSKAFDTKLTDAVTVFNGVRVTKGNYNPITGESDDITIKYTGRGVFGSYALSLIDGESILATDHKLMTRSKIIPLLIWQKTQLMSLGLFS